MKPTQRNKKPPSHCLNLEKVFRCKTSCMCITIQNKHIQMQTCRREAFPSQNGNFSFLLSIFCRVQFPKLSDLRTNTNVEQHITELSIRAHTRKKGRHNKQLGGCLCYCRQEYSLDIRTMEHICVRHTQNTHTVRFKFRSSSKKRETPFAQTQILI